MDHNENENDVNYGSAHGTSNNDDKRPIEDCQSLTAVTENLHRKFAHQTSGRYFYALLTGFQSVDAVTFYKTMFPLCLSQNISTIDDTKMTSDQLEQTHKDLLVGAFEYLEYAYERDLSEKLTEKTLLDLELQEKNAEKYPQINDRLKELTRSLSSGLSAVLALIYKQKLYVASTGDTRAYLAREVFEYTIGKSLLKAVPLTDIHSVMNMQELAQLSSSQIDIKTAQANGKIGNMKLTRCLGNFYMKKFYKEFPEFEQTSADVPIKWEPSVKDMSLDKSCHFLVLSSATVIDLIEWILEKADKTLTPDDADKDKDEDPRPVRTAAAMLIEIVGKHFLKESSMRIVAQKTLQEVIALFRNHFGLDCKNLELSLIVRDLRSEFGFPKTQDGQLSNNFSDLHIDVNALPLEKDGSSSDQVDQIDSPDTVSSLPDGPFPRPSDSNEEIDAYVDFSSLLQAFGES